jgi:xylulokinase
MMVATVLVLDVGTSSVKAVLFGSRGAMLAASEAEYGPATAAHRQAVEEWVRATRTAVGALGSPSIGAIALAGTMENLIAVDADGRAVHDAILYSDPCGAPFLDLLSVALERLDAPAILGNAPEPLMTMAKAQWLRETRPVAWDKARWLLPGAKDYLAFHLTGRAVTDPATATTTGLMDLRTREWSAPLLAACDVPRARLPAILPAGAVIGAASPARAAILGLAIDRPVPVINGAGDAAATTVGSFCRDAGDISLYLGTSGWVARVVPAGALPPKPEVYRLAHPTEGLLIEVTPILSAGGAGNWIRHILDLGTEARDAALAVADAAPADTVFLPYLSGERFPFFDAEVRAAFLGLSADSSREALYYAVLEGVGLAIRANLERLDPQAEGRIRLAGGGAQSVVWPQMLADILRRPVGVPADPANATATGAFLVAAEALGLEGTPATPARIVMPRPDRAARAMRLAEVFARGTAAMRAQASRKRDAAAR